MNEIQTILDKWSQSKIKELQENYLRIGLKASGNWSKKLDYEAEATDNKATVKITGANYTYWLENGRGKTTKKGDGSLKSIIRKWIDVKGIIPRDNISKDSLAYLITRKIHERGIPVPNPYNAGGLVSKVINKPVIDELTKELGQAKLKEVKSEILKSIRL